MVTILLAGAGYWYFFMQTGAAGLPFPSGSSNGQTGFQPFSRPPSGTSPSSSPTGTATTSQNGQAQGSAYSLPVLRLLSDTPVGGYGASTTASTTVVRWVDRGRGNIYQATYDSANITTLSNTVVPRIYGSVWDRNLVSFIGSLFQSGDTAPSTVYAQLVAQATSTASAQASSSPDSASLTPYVLRGKNIPGDVVSYAASPDGKSIFMFAVQNGEGIGYTAPFNGGTATQIFTTPLTQASVDWPAPNIISITTAGSAYEPGYLYFVDPKTGVWKKVIGPLPGLSAKVSHDGKYAILSATGNKNNVVTSIYSVASSTGTDAVIRTLADKCAWGDFYKDVVYCGVPSQAVPGTYPDDWYKGTLSTNDQIWQVDAATGAVHLVSPIISQSDRVIDAFDLSLDPKDDYLFFMNKNDLSLWSLDLVRSQ
ncbi:MAG: hypothetical protein KGI69_03880 [Patescibacteria group bacterium]|nr:hypothetical protein [Patescibacteria group bacterium]